MNIDDGRIKESDDVSLDEIKDFVGIHGELTEKQKKEKKVSLHDHRSEAGKQLTEERRKRGITKNRYRKMKRKGKLK